MGLALNRKEKDFSERDRGVLDFLSPHISQAYQNAQTFDAMEVNLKTIGEGLDSMQRALVLCGRDGQIHWQSALAREWLREFFEDFALNTDRLPLALVKRLNDFELSSSVAQPKFREILGPTGADFRLLIYCGQSCSGEYVLALVRERTKIDLAVAQSYGLTPREAEILFWISEAKTRPEIGVILGISWRTIGKHLEHLFEKLGVENRHEAQRLGLELRRM